MQQVISVGVLVSTYNWPQALERIFLSILKQTRLPDELLIADDGSGEETRYLVDRYRNIFRFPVQHAWHEDKGFRKSVILNKAVKLARADYIIEIDGDIILHPKFIEDHLKQAQPGYFVQGSRAILSEDITKRLLHNQHARLHFLSAGIHNRFNAIRAPLFSFLIKTNALSPANTKACNLAFWRKDFLAVNGYNNLFRGWGLEDNEFAARLIHGGILKKRLKLAAICYHLHHECNSKAAFNKNKKRYVQTIHHRIVTCANGYLQV
ncbi:glycosyltransferase family 2 protein [Deminuibacter soli]|uniref:Glycosyltransferase n=1 Tax=Deminuibacter soli TaxID=2291815 RepID=A0A3E1NJ59_9BACT|nr:glycosyltransferase family 2 protein [Deminuibacter soli]RFM27818.1 glycosyltransferase [Deminuibacter soli]